MSLSARRAWIEIRWRGRSDYRSDRSLSARRAWIEILVARPGVDPGGVALRKESVDRNAVEPSGDKAQAVALRKESVDRNITMNHQMLRIRVALRKESVDRNGQGVIHLAGQLRRSPQGERG